MKNNPDLWTEILQGLKDAWPQISGSIAAIIVCYGRLIYDGVDRKNKWIEGILCGALSLCISSALDIIGVPASAAPFAGGLVGFIGVEKLREIAINTFNRRVGGDK
ncbi:phage holin, lambda family [Photorhabdus luminescens]|nr:phage holin, lambda family [Photorhabdus luminescens]